MSSQIFTPINQVKLTNVSIVRLRTGGCRFELACYRNKLSDYRNGLTKDLDQVLQSRYIFSNVSKGQLANQADLERCFPDKQHHSKMEEEIILDILNKGEVQINEREREMQLQTLTKEIATMVTERCLNPNTKTPYPITVIERAMTEGLHFSVKSERSAKQQALDVIKQLQERKILNIVRARLRLQVIISSSSSTSLENKLDTVLKTLQEQFEVEVEDSIKGIILVVPGAFRPLQQVVTSLNASVVTLSIKE